MRIAYYSPMPPARTGVADYSAALLPYLREHGEVLVNPVSSRGAVPIYHIGNNAQHRDIYLRALAEPGVAVIHDAVLQHFFLGSLTEQQYLDEFTYNYGEFARGEAKSLWDHRAVSGADARYFARPMLKRIATHSRAVIVHNPAAAAWALEHAPEAEVHVIPHLFVRPQLPDAVDTLRLRASLGLGPRTLLIASFGHQRETKRLRVVMRAFRDAIQRGADTRLLVAGKFVSETFARAMVPDLLHPAVIHRGYLSESDLWRYAAATDVCVNLRYPSAAESSGIATRLMGIGKVVIFTRDRSTADFPDDACLRVDVGAGESQTLADYICWLAGTRDAVRRIGAHAAEHIARYHAPERVARMYWDGAENSESAAPSTGVTTHSFASGFSESR